MKRNKLSKVLMTSIASATIAASVIPNTMPIFASESNTVQVSQSKNIGSARDQLLAKIQKQQKKVDELEASAKEQESQLTALRTKADEEKSSKSTLKATIDQQSQEISNTINVGLSSLDSQKQQIESMIENVKSNIADDQLSKDEIAKDLEKAQSDLAEQQAKLQDLQAQLDALNAGTSVQATSDTSQKDAQATLDKANKKLSKAQALLESYQGLELSYEQVQKAYDGAKANNADNLNEYETNLNNAKTALIQFLNNVNENEEAETNFEAVSNATFTTLQTNVEQATQAVSEAQSALDQANANNQASNTAEQSQSAAQIQAQIDQINQTIASLNQQIADLQNKTAIFDDQIAQENAKIDDYNQRLENIQNSANPFEKAKAALENVLKSGMNADLSGVEDQGLQEQLHQLAVNVSEYKKAKGFTSSAANEYETAYLMYQSTLEALKQAKEELGKSTKSLNETMTAKAKETKTAQTKTTQAKVQNNNQVQSNQNQTQSAARTNTVQTGVETDLLSSAAMLGLVGLALVGVKKHMDQDDEK